MTVAQIVDFDTRADVGLVPPRSRSTNIDPTAGGSVLHYGGADVPVSSHEDCRRYWRSWQSMHMRPGGLGTRDGAADIAYNLGVCQHGVGLAGRGAGIRSGANGTVEANGGWYAICAIVGARQQPTGALLDAFAWAVATLRDADAGDDVSPHSRFRPTGCPGDPIRNAIPTIRGAADRGPAREDDPMASLDPDRLALLDDLAGALLGLDPAGRGTSLAHALTFYREVAELAGVGGHRPDEVAARVVIARTPAEAALLRGTVRRLAELDEPARDTSLAHVLSTHRAIAAALDVPGNDPAAIARALVELDQRH